MIYELDLHMTQENMVIGKLTQEIIDLLELPYEEKDIVLWKGRIKYLEKHQSDFPSEEAFIKHLKAIPSVIKTPEYVGLHPKGNSIQFIKRIDDLMLVAVRISHNQNWAFRSAYPISQDTFNAYLQANTVKKV
ncbi:PBECR2 nuclease fold domain-containing protein [Paenibacillus sp. FSL R10-2782]|uniref:PBECR3 domain-containing polyvalent protein n=1 Tax=Paenibacillus sp. FSL R10-2782 TaxID=2954661 RepID=UPI0031596D7F